MAGLYGAYRLAKALTPGGGGRGRRRRKRSRSKRRAAKLQAFKAIAKRELDASRIVSPRLLTVEEVLGMYRVGLPVRKAVPPKRPVSRLSKALSLKKAARKAAMKRSFASHILRAAKRSVVRPEYFLDADARPKRAPVEHDRRVFDLRSRYPRDLDGADGQVAVARSDKAGAPARLRVLKPKTITLCVRRSRRREVMFATGKAGGSVRRFKKRRITEDSSLSCK